MNYSVIDQGKVHLAAFDDRVAHDLRGDIHFASFKILCLTMDWKCIYILVIQDLCPEVRALQCCYVTDLFEGAPLLQPFSSGTDIDTDMVFFYLKK